MPARTCIPCLLDKATIFRPIFRAASVLMPVLFRLCRLLADTETSIWARFGGDCPFHSRHVQRKRAEGNTRNSGQRGKKLFRIRHLRHLAGMDK